LRLGRELAHHRDFVRSIRTIKDLRQWLIHQRDGRGANVNAVCLGRLSASKRPPQDYAALGRAGALKRWARRRGDHPAEPATDPA
jgi:hypothetical protein